MNTYLIRIYQVDVRRSVDDEINIRAQIRVIVFFQTHSHQSNITFRNEKISYPLKSIDDLLTYFHQRSVDKECLNLDPKATTIESAVGLDLYVSFEIITHHK